MAPCDVARFRMFAGPNGSGKSELFKFLRAQHMIHTELYVSADRIEKQLKETGKFHFNAYRISTEADEFMKHVETHGLWKGLGYTSASALLQLKGGILQVKRTKLNSYVASFIASYLCSKIFKTGQSYCFETVMSHQSKVEMFSEARKSKYKNYLYFVYTTNPNLNIARIHQRARTGGHFVADHKVRDRYHRSLRNLPSAMQACDVGYMIDNTGSDFQIVAEKKNARVIWHQPKAQDFWRTKGISLN